MQINLLKLENTPIYEQLQLEEALLRTTDENYCIINIGSPPSIVMGISAKLEDVIFKDSVSKNMIPVIKRFSGGGTVIVDSDTIFVSFIFKQDLINTPLYPEPILRWTEGFYQNALNIKGFALKENDYVIGQHKCAGNAQYIQKNRFVHHTTFLWDFCKNKMNHLKFPKKVPNYRNTRPHDDFLCKLKSHLTKNDFVSAIQTELGTRFETLLIDRNRIKDSLNNPHRKATQLIKF